MARLKCSKQYTLAFYVMTWICDLLTIVFVQCGQKCSLVSPDDLDLSFDDKRVCNCEALQHLGQLHELLPAPVMLLLAESMQGICSQQSGSTIEADSAGHLYTLPGGPSQDPSACCLQ